jgi:hypothetical protein
MLNINGKLLEDLDESEYFLFSILLNYGTKSRPDNGVLMHRTKWGLQKLQKVKKSLVSKGVLTVNARFDRKDNKRGRASNEYRINTKLASKYNGFQLNDFHVIEIQLDENQLHEIQLHDFKLHENHTGNKVLKYSIIETIKILKEESKKALTQENENLLLKVQKLEAVNLELKNKSEAQKEKPKSSAKKVKANASGFPSMDEFDQKNPPHQIEVKAKYENSLSKFVFPVEWGEELKESFLTYCAAMDEKSLGKWGTFTQIKLHISDIKGFLNKFDKDTVSAALIYAAKNGNTNYNPQWTLNRNERDKKKSIFDNDKPATFSFNTKVTNGS